MVSLGSSGSLVSFCYSNTHTYIHPINVYRMFVNFVVLKKQTNKQYFEMNKKKGGESAYPYVEIERVDM
jgi:hypothetical protein